MIIKIYNPNMQSRIESCFKICVETLGWEYQPQGRHSDIVNIEETYMRCGCFWCLFQDDVLIGMIAARCIDSDNKVAELKRLYVLPEYQGNGYGGILFKHALDYVKDQGYKTIRVDTRHDRVASLHLINKHRFRRIERYNNNEFAELYFELDVKKNESEESSMNPANKGAERFSRSEKFRMTIDYNKLAQDYDLTRTANINIINLFAAEMSLDSITILDFGCGTGNFMYVIKKLTTAVLYGVEPSDDMREKALSKGLDVRNGDHSIIPFGDSFFDFIYMTDVIHHVQDLKIMFSEFFRILKPGGFICILTESHRQLETRFWVKHFPTTVAVEKKRYPDIPDIINAAKSYGLDEYKIITTDTDSDITITEDFIKLAENKGFSMFRLIEESDYETGLIALKTDFANQTTIHNNHGETLVWLKKGGAI